VSQLTPLAFGGRTIQAPGCAAHAGRAVEPLRAPLAGCGAAVRPGPGHRPTSPCRASKGASSAALGTQAEAACHGGEQRADAGGAAAVQGARCWSGDRQPMVHARYPHHRGGARCGADERAAAARRQAQSLPPSFPFPPLCPPSLHPLILPLVPSFFPSSPPHPFLPPRQQPWPHMVALIGRSFRQALRGSAGAYPPRRGRHHRCRSARCARPRARMP
jgi:hypothetical protein